MNLFGRRAEVRIQTDTGATEQSATISASQGVSVATSTVHDILTVKNLDVRFKVHRSLTKDPNKAEIIIYNLNSVHREALEQRDSAAVRLLVGYDSLGNDLWQIFAGTLRSGFSAKNAPDWVTTLRSGDGDKDARRLRISRSYPKGVKWEEMLRAVLSEMDAGPGNAMEAFRSSASAKDSIQQLANGGQLHGPVMKELERIARTNGMEFSVQDGEVQMLGIGKALAGTAVVLSPTTGLIGSPERGKKGEIKLRSLLIPDLVPGRKIVLKSRHLNADLRAEKIVYKGDTAANDWYADITCKGLK